MSIVDGSDVLPEYLEAARAWETLGFDVDMGAYGDMRECPRRWYVSGDIDCQITLEVIREPMLRERRGTDALSDIAARGIAIDTRVADRVELTAAMAHESGHILLDTPEHTQGGIMGGASIVVTDVDLELACRTIGRGC